MTEDHPSGSRAGAESGLGFFQWGTAGLITSLPAPQHTRSVMMLTMLVASKVSPTFRVQMAVKNVSAGWDLALCV